MKECIFQDSLGKKELTGWLNLHSPLLVIETNCLLKTWSYNTFVLVGKKALRIGKQVSAAQRREKSFVMRLCGKQPVQYDQYDVIDE